MLPSPNVEKVSSPTKENLKPAEPAEAKLKQENATSPPKPKVPLFVEAEPKVSFPITVTPSSQSQMEDPSKDPSKVASVLPSQLPSKLQGGKEIPESKPEIVKKKESNVKLEYRFMVNCHFNYVKKFDKAFKYLVYCMAYSPLLKMVAVGLDSGSVVVFTMEKEKFSGEKTFLSPHAETVYSVAFDEERGYLISVGTDNRVIAYDLKKDSSISLLVVPGKGPSGFKYDSQSKTGFFSNKGQSVYVLDFSGRDIEIVSKITTELASPIATIEWSNFCKTLFVASQADGKIKLYKSRDFKDATIKMVTHMELQGPKNVRTMTYNSDRNELWLGTTEGTLILFPKITPLGVPQTTFPLTECPPHPLKKQLESTTYIYCKLE